jgi:hypothetical protein
MTGCRVGDGTLEVTDDRQTYKNEHIQWLWMRYKTAHKERMLLAHEVKGL